MTFVEERGQEIYEAIEARRGSPSDPIKPIFEAYGRETSIDPGTVSSTYYAHRRRLKERASAPAPPPVSGASNLAVLYYQAVTAKLAADQTLTQKDAITQVSEELGRTRQTVQSGFYKTKREVEGPGTMLDRTKIPERAAAKTKVRSNGGGSKARKVKKSSQAVIVRKAARQAVPAPLQGVVVDKDMNLSSLLRVLADKVEADEASHAADKAEHEALKAMVRGLKAQLPDL
jgi:hypothetical protein